MLANVQRKTIKPIIEKAIAKGTLVFTDEYDIYGNLKRMGYEAAGRVIVDLIPAND